MLWIYVTLCCCSHVAKILSASTLYCFANADHLRAQPENDAETNDFKEERTLNYAWQEQRLEVHLFLLYTGTNEVTRIHLASTRWESELMASNLFTHCRLGINVARRCKEGNVYNRVCWGTYHNGWISQPHWTITSKKRGTQLLLYDNGRLQNDWCRSKREHCQVY